MNRVDDRSPPVLEPARSPLPRIFYVLIAALLLVALGASLLLLAARRATPREQLKLPADVTVEILELETNTQNVVRALVVVRNESETTLEFGYAVQVHGQQGWAHTNGNPSQFALHTDDDPLLPPHSERQFAVRQPTTGDPWRVVAMCWTPPGKSGQRGKPFIFFSPEQNP